MLLLLLTTPVFDNLQFIIIVIIIIAIINSMLPLCRVFTHIYLKQTVSGEYGVVVILQLVFMMHICFMQDIYTCIPETYHVCREYSVAAIP
jgi:hypothetical protein